MSHLPPNKGSKVLSAAVVMAILGSSNAMARLARIEPSTASMDAIHSAHRSVKGDTYYGDASPYANEADLWATSESKIDKDEGTSTDKLYAALSEMGLNTQQKVVVAVIDSGVDITHKDLQGHIWTNPGETGVDANGKDKATNGIDDDGDGFIDDVHGWNFIGAIKDGKPVSAKDNTLERTREYARLQKLVTAGTLAATDAYYVAVKKNYEDTLGDFPAECSRLDFNASDLIGDKGEELQPVCASGSLANRKARKGCLKSSYGNNDVSGRDPNGKVYDAHATHVAGIIAAVRDNDLGIQGQATNVEIMSIRAVPGCDERDKDVANAIRYVADMADRYKKMGGDYANVKFVANMSFGKNFSPHKDWVDEAVAYAQSKGVLLVHAAGNEAENNDRSQVMTESKIGNYPNQFHFDAKGKPTDVAANWIEVGAATRHDHLFMDPRRGPSYLAASFSNVGKQSVNLFAPGQGIRSTVPGDLYATYDGTSMASPETAGVAALLFSIFPEANYASIRKAMIENTSQYPSVKVSGDVLFSDLSISGGIVNAYQAAKALKADRDARSVAPGQPEASGPVADTATQTSAPTKQKTQSTVQSAEARNTSKHKSWFARVFGL